MSQLFRYKAKDAGGQAKNGEIQALDEKDAVKKLQEQGLFVISIDAWVSAASGKPVDILTAKEIDRDKEKGVFQSQSGEENSKRKCPFCAEEIQNEAIKCKHCGEMFKTNKVAPKRIAITCPKCLKEHDSSWKVCFDCAVPLILREVEIDTKEGIAVIGDVSQVNPPSTCPITCPRCGSKQIMTVKKGYNAESGCCGAILLGPLGLLCGASDANKLSNVCQKCGHRWEL